MIGVLANTAGVVAGGLIGLLCKKGIPERISKAMMYVIGAYNICIGVMGVFKVHNQLVLLVSMVLGTLVGELIDIEAAVNALGAKLEQRAKATEGGLSRGFITATLLFCTGAMGIVGSIQAGTVGDNTMLYTKTVLDIVGALLLAASLGAGVVLSAASVLVYEGAIVLLAGVLAPVLTDVMIAEITAAGSLMIVMLGLNIMDIAKLRVANTLPAVVLAPFLSVLFEALHIG